MVYWIEHHEEGKARIVSIRGNALSVGRGADNDVVLSDPRSSRHHCKVQRTPQGLLLEDLESRNGTQLNGYAVKKSVLKAGDEFRVGNVRFLVREGESVPAEVGGPASAPSPSLPAASDAARLATAWGAGESAVEDGAATGATPPDARRTGGEPGILEDVEGESEGGVGAPAPPPARGTGAAPAALEGIQGTHVGEKIAVEKSPFVLGRAKECDFRIGDARASSHHARIVREEQGYVLEDLGSTNGTLLNKRPVKRALLFPGALLQIGNTVFRVHVPVPTGAQRGTALVAAEDEPEDVVRIDADKLLARDRTQQPLAVIAVVVSALVVCYFAVDVTRRLVRVPDIDAALSTNLVGRAWSFERPGDIEGTEPAEPEGEGGALRWRLRGWKAGVPSDSAVGGRMEPTATRARSPGRRALRLTSTDSESASVASVELKSGIEGGATYRLEGFVASEGAFAAGLVVEWLRESRGSSVVVGRSFGEAVPPAGEAIEVDQLVTAPPGSTAAFASCYVLGTGSAIFDRVSLARAEAPAPGAEGGAAEGAGLEERHAWVRGLPAEIEGQGKEIELVAQGDGSFSVRISGTQELVPAFWTALAPSSDPHACGPRLVSPRAAVSDESSFLSVGMVPDLAQRRWATIETKAVASREGVSILWRTAAQEPGSDREGLCLYVETTEGMDRIELSAGEGGDQADREGAAAGDAVRELVIGEGDNRVSLALVAPLKVVSRPHPWKPGRLLWCAETASASLEVIVSRGSRSEASAAVAYLEKAEAEFRAGQAGAAMQALAKMRELYPNQRSELLRAEQRLTEWRAQAADAVKEAAEDLQELRRVPNPVLKDLLEQRLADTAERYRNTSDGGSAAKLLDELRGFWDGREQQEKEEAIKGFHDTGKRYFAQDQLSLAEQYLKWVVEADADGERGRDAANILKLIEGRRQRDVKILLR